MTLSLGVASRDVTPAHPVQLAGFGRRAGALVSEVGHPIRIRVAIIGDASRALALVSGEFLAWSTESDERFRRIAAQHTGVEPNDILFSATHTHSAPQLSHRHAQRLGVVDERYLDQVAAALAEACAEAAAERHEVTLSRAIDHHELAWHRRTELDLSVDPTPPRIDDRLTIVRFDGADRLIACFVHYACHPVVSADPLVSGDYFGVAVAEVERATGAVVFPLQGCAGDVDPRGAAMAGIHRAGEIGHELADAVLALTAGAAVPIHPGSLRATWATARLPFTAIPDLEELRLASDDAGLVGEWARGLLAHPELIRPSVECRLQLWYLGADLQLLAMSGEVTSEYGLRIREISGGTTLPVAYSNGMVGYIPTARQIAAGGYEVDESARCYLLAGTFDPAIESIMNEGIDSLMSQEVADHATR